MSSLQTLNYHTLRPFFMRFSKSLLFHMCADEKSSFVMKKSSTTKDCLCRHIAERVIDGRLTLREIEEMDLKWYFSCKNRNWKVYKLENTGLNNHIALTDPMKFEKDFEKELKHHFNCRVCILFEKNILLTRISPCNEENLFLSLSSTIYMICVPRSSHVLMSNLKAAHKKFVLKAIENIFCCGLDEMDFCGRSDSLFNLILNMSSQGQFSNFRLNQIDENPLSRKRKRDIGNDDDNKENVMSVNEEHVKDKTRKIYALKTFGSHQQPALEKIEFKMFTKFKGGRYIGDEEQEEIKDVVKCSAQFKGKNVVEGIKNCVSMVLLHNHCHRI